MKKKLFKMFVTVMTILFFISGCANTSDDSSDQSENQSDDATAITDNGEESTDSSEEDNEITLAVFSTSGQVYQYMADEKGYLEEEGINVNMEYINSGTDAFAALDAGEIDVASSYGTSGPMMQIANGRDFQIFGGYMMQGATPVFAKPETEFNDLEDFEGKRIGVLRGGNPHVVLASILYDAGIDPQEDVEFVEIGSHPDIISAVSSDEIDFGIVGTGLELQIEDAGLEVKMWPEDYWPNYNCCRMVTNTEWLDNNPETAKKLLRAYLKAERDIYYNDEMNLVVEQVIDNLDQTQAQAESFLYNDKLKYDLDPNRNAVLYMWDKMETMGFIEDTDVNPQDHINIDLYKEALDSLLEENPEDEYYLQKAEQYEEINF